MCTSGHTTTARLRPSDMENNLNSQPLSARNADASVELEPAAWWRRLCFVDDTRLAICGDLPSDDDAALAQLEGWVAAGITHIVDVREEHNDEAFVIEHAPHIDYTWLGTHDDGGSQDPEWFALGVGAILAALADPSARVVVHCHMGVNRAPSMAFGALLALGYEPVPALAAIRSARPIAGILYAESALRWWNAATGASEWATEAQLDAMERWFVTNWVDVSWVISRIWCAYDEAA
jgi:dual specificity phosphatase 3